MSGQARAAIAAAKARAAKQRIKDVWVAQLSVEYKEAKKNLLQKLQLYSMVWIGRKSTQSRAKTHRYVLKYVTNFSVPVIFENTILKSLL